MNESPPPRGTAVTPLRRLDDLLFRGEQSMISVFLIAMTAMVFIDIVYRRLIAPDSRIGNFIGSIAGIDPDSPQRATIDAKVAPVVGAAVGLFLLWFAFRSAERNIGRKLLPIPASAVALALGTTVALIGFGWLLLSLQSRDVYLVLYALGAGAYVVHLVRKRPEGWLFQLLGIVCVLTPCFLTVAFLYFPTEYTWAKELAMLMVLWVGFFGASLCVHEGKHIRFEALEKTYPPAARPFVVFAGHAGAAALCIFLAWLGYQYVFAPDTGTFSIGMRLQATGIPDWVMSVSIPVAFGLSALRFIAAGVSALMGGSYGAAAKAEGMEEAEQLAAEKTKEEAASAEAAAQPEKDEAASATPVAPAKAAPPKPRTAIFYVVLALAIAAALLGGKPGIMVGAILLAALLAEPLFVVLGIVTILCFTLWGDVTRPGEFSILIERIRGLADNKTLLAVPFYVMSGAVMGRGQIGKRLVDFSNALFGWLPGGLAISVIFGCILFAAISGSSPATVIAIGSVMGPALIAHRYRPDFSLGLITSAGSLGILIPPSIPMIIYCIVNTTTVMKVDEFFAAGIVPGFVIGGVLAAYSAFRGIRDRTPREPFSLKNLFSATRDGTWALLFPVLIIGGIYGGFLDEIEAACTSVVYALFVEVYVHRAFGLRDVPKVFMEVGVMLGSFLVVLVIAISFGEFLVLEGIPQAAAGAIRDMNLEPWQFLLIVNLLLLVVGCLMDIMSAIFIFVPLIAPMAAAMGIDPIHLGIIFIVNLEIGYLTPPVGLNLFVAATLFRRPIGFIIRAVLPFIAVMLVGLLVITYVPSITVDSARWIMSIAREPRRPVTSPGAVPDGGTVPDETPAGEGDLGDVQTIEQMMEAMDQQEDEQTVDAGPPDAGP